MGRHTPEIDLSPLSSEGQERMASLFEKYPHLIIKLMSETEYVLAEHGRGMWAIVVYEHLDLGLGYKYIDMNSIEEFTAGGSQQLTDLVGTYDLRKEIIFSFYFHNQKDTITLLMNISEDNHDTPIN